MNPSLPILLAAASGVLAGLFVYLYARKHILLRRLSARFKGVIDVDAEKKRVEAEIELLKERQARSSSPSTEPTELRSVSL